MEINIVSGQWNGMLPSDEVIKAISDVFCGKDFNIHLYYINGSMIKGKSASNGVDLHIGFYGCASVNEFANMNEASNVSHTLHSVQVKYSDTTEFISVDTGVCTNSSIDIKVLRASDEKEVVVARVTYPNTICILLQPTNIPTSLLEYILLSSKEYINCSEQDFKAVLRNNAKDNLLKALRLPFKQQQVQKIKDIEDIKAHISRLENNLNEKENELRVAEQELITLSECCDDTSGIAEVLSSIEAIDKISSVKSSSGCDFIGEGIIKVYTNTIYVNSQRRRYLLGEYEITLNFLTQKVSFKNLNTELRRQSHWGSGCHHPHVSSDGSACLGNIKEDIKEALKAYNFQHAVLLAVSFLRNVNINDTAGKRIVNWPMVDDEGNIINDCAGELEKCYICGEIMPDNEDGELWVKCECCGKYVCPNHSEAVTINDRTVSVCSQCFSSSLKYCSVCGKVEMVDNMYPLYDFSDNSSRLDPTGDYLCEECVRTIKTVVPASEGILAHRKVFVSSEFEEKYIKECETCGEKFASNDESETQCPYCKSGRTYFTCPDCGAITPSMWGASVVINGEETQVCLTCSEEYVTCMQCLNQVKESESSVMNESLGLYICNSCKQTLTEED